MICVHVQLLCAFDPLKIFIFKFDGYIYNMESFNFTSPIVIAIGGILLLLILYFWNKRLSNKNSQRRRRSFRDNYYDRKKEKENT